MTTTLRVNIKDIDLQFIKELEAQAGPSAELEIRVESGDEGEGLFTEDQFWGLIEQLDWSTKERDKIIAPVIESLSKMPISSVYLFADILSEKLYDIDTRLHAEAYMKQQPDEYFSVDDFLYVRCAVVAEGKLYYEQIKQHPERISASIDFEHILSVAGAAYMKKTGRVLEYIPRYNYETKSNVEGWQ